MNDLNEDPDTARALALAGELRVVVGRTLRRLREEADSGDLNWSQMRVLYRLDRDGATTVTGLARVEGMRPQSMGETVTSLKAAGFVTGAPDPDDGRQTVLSLTSAGLEVVKTARAAREDWLFHAITTTLTPAEQKKLASAVGLLRRIAES